MSKLIPLTQGKSAIVDDQDFEWLSQWKWCAHKDKNKWYAMRGVYTKGKVISVQMHRLILAAPQGREVDHWDGDGLNNQRHNLRLATQHENQRNRKNPNSNNTSGYKGVSWHKKDEKWVAQIIADGKHLNLGRFNTPEDAARAYDKAARNYYKEFASLNFPDER